MKRDAQELKIIFYHISDSAGEIILCNTIGTTDHEHCTIIRHDQMLGYYQLNMFLILFFIFCSNTKRFIIHILTP